MMYAAYCEELRAVCRAKGMTLELLGTVNRHGAYPLYKIVLNDTKRAQRTVCFSAGIHGDETSAPIAVLEFLRRWKPGNAPHTKIILFPVVNPWGYDRGRNRNHEHLNLNRHFCDPKLRHEPRLFYNAIKNENLLLFCSLHEDDTKNDFYFYAYDRARRWDPLYDAIFRAAAPFLPRCTHRTIHHNPANRGLVWNKRDGAFEDRMNRDGVPYSLCLEITDTLPFETMVSLNVKLMYTIVRAAPRLTHGL